MLNLSNKSLVNSGYNLSVGIDICCSTKPSISPTNFSVVNPSSFDSKKRPSLIKLIFSKIDLSNKILPFPKEISPL